MELLSLPTIHSARRLGHHSGLPPRLHVPKLLVAPRTVYPSPRHSGRVVLRFGTGSGATIRERVPAGPAKPRAISVATWPLRCSVEGVGLRQPHPPSDTKQPIGGGVVDGSVRG